MPRQSSSLVWCECNFCVRTTAGQWVSVDLAKQHARRQTLRAYHMRQSTAVAQAWDRRRVQRLRPDEHDSVHTAVDAADDEVGDVRQQQDGDEDPAGGSEEAHAEQVEHWVRQSLPSRCGGVDADYQHLLFGYLQLPALLGAVPSPPSSPGNSPRPPATSQNDIPVWAGLLHILVLWLSSARGLSRACANLILSFFADFVIPGHAPPRQLATIRSRLGGAQTFTRYVMCPAHGCAGLWKAMDAPRTCNQCSTDLFKDSTRDKPICFLSYAPLTSFLRSRLATPGFEAAVNAWRTRPPSTVLGDLSDGPAWSELRDQDDSPFTSGRLNFMLAVGLDWFSPFDRRGAASYSAGAVTIRVDNLPPRPRNRPENIHLVTVLPGPQQTSDAALHATLQLLVDELIVLDEGVDVDVDGVQKRMRARIWLALGDTPGRAKLSGFPNHNQLDQWCAYCTADARGWAQALLQHQRFASRDPDQHRAAARQAFDEPHLQEQCLRVHAATWTPLYNLPYWSSVLSSPVDAMHCLHLGAVKRFFHATLIEGQLLQREGGAFPIIADVLRTAVYPRGVDAINPDFGASKAGSPKADTWSVFGRFFLPLVLVSHWHALIPLDGTRTFISKHKAFRPPRLPRTSPFIFRREVKVRVLVDMALSLARSVQLTQRRRLSAADINELDHCIRHHVSLMALCIDPRWLVPNHHSLLHIPDQARRFGPPRGYWFYSLERMNGFLKSSPHNNHRSGEIELTFQNGHVDYRAVQDSIRLLSPSREEQAFRTLLSAHGVRSEPYDDGDEWDRQGAAMFGQGRWELLPPSTLTQVIDLLNANLTPNPIDGGNLATRAGADDNALVFDSIMVQGVRVSVDLTRSNLPGGSSNLAVRTAHGVRVGTLRFAFRHAYADRTTGVDVHVDYLQVALFRHIPWPVQHVITAQAASRLGYCLADPSVQEIVLVTAYDVLDTFVSANATYFAPGLAPGAVFVAQMHP